MITSITLAVLMVTLFVLGLACVVRALRLGRKESGQFGARLAKLTAGSSAYVTERMPEYMSERVLQSFRDRYNQHVPPYRDGDIMWVTKQEYDLLRSAVEGVGFIRTPLSASSVYGLGILRFRNCEVRVGIDPKELDRVEIPEETPWVNYSNHISSSPEHSRLPLTSTPTSSASSTTSTKQMTTKQIPF